MFSLLLFPTLSVIDDVAADAPLLLDIIFRLFFEEVDEGTLFAGVPERLPSPGVPAR